MSGAYEVHRASGRDEKQGQCIGPAPPSSREVLCFPLSQPSCLKGLQTRFKPVLTQCSYLHRGLTFMS